MDSEELLTKLAAVNHAQRLRIIDALAPGRVHVSELARRLGLSRPLLYMHLERLEKAGFVAGRLELSADGKAMKYFELVPFELQLTAETVVAALRADEEAALRGDEVAAPRGDEDAAPGADEEEGPETMQEDPS